MHQASLTVNRFSELLFPTAMVLTPGEVRTVQPIELLSGVREREGAHCPLLESPCLKITWVLTKVDAFQGDTCPPQHLSPAAPLANRPVTRVKSQHGPDLIGKKRDYSLKKLHGLELGRKMH